MTTTFYSNGKLLITAEYLVLDGAKAFALPTKFGQSLTITETNKPQIINWESYNADSKIWFKEQLTFHEIINFEKPAVENERNTLIRILHETYNLNPKFLTIEKGLEIKTKLTFPKNWGLGTSSTLINNIAQWANVDAFTLLNKSFGGSGYDIACAQNSHPIIYELSNSVPIVTPTTFEPTFKENIYFVYLNQKQNSKNAISAYNLNKKHNLPSNIAYINQISDQLRKATTLSDFIRHLRDHEQFMSTILETPTVQSALFTDFEGQIKSLGAWGGDFVLVCADSDPTAYFKAKGYHTILPYEEMIL